MDCSVFPVFLAEIQFLSSIDEEGLQVFPLWIETCFGWNQPNVNKIQGQHQVEYQTVEYEDSA